LASSIERVVEKSTRDAKKFRSERDSLKRELRLMKHRGDKALKRVVSEAKSALKKGLAAVSAAARAGKPHKPKREKKVRVKKVKKTKVKKAKVEAAKVAA